MAKTEVKTVPAEPDPTYKYDATLNIYQRINKVMSEVSYVQKSGTLAVNGKKLYSFVKHDDVTATIQPMLVKYGITIITSVRSHTQDGNRTEILLWMNFVNIDKSEDCVSIEVMGYGIDSQDKGPGKAMSYAKKYGLLQMFCLETGDDPENDSIEHEPKPPKPKMVLTEQDKTEILNVYSRIKDATQIEDLDKLWLEIKPLRDKVMQANETQYSAMLAGFRTRKGELAT